MKNDASFFRKHTTVFIYLLIVLFTIGPILSLLLSSVLATLAGCEVNEARTPDCELLGFQIGGLISTLFIAGWLSMVTIPFGGIAFFAWTIIVILRYAKKK